MDTTALKLVLTPALIGAASLAGRRWGPSVSGWLVGLPLTSAPIAFFLALTHGVSFAATAATGTLAGTISQASFCLAYGWLAGRVSWPACVAAGSVVFFACTAALRVLDLAPLPLFLVVALVLAVAIRVMPAPQKPPASEKLPRWDIAARMVVATVFVLFLTGIASQLGAQLTGLLAPFPLYAAILTVFAHQFHGGDQANHVLRGLLFGLFGFAGFFLALGTLLPRAGIGLAFVAASVTALTFHAATLWRLKAVR